MAGSDFADSLELARIETSLGLRFARRAGPLGLARIETTKNHGSAFLSCVLPVFWDWRGLKPRATIPSTLVAGSLELARIETGWSRLGQFGFCQSFEAGED